ncbi:hypothetical protein [Pusillimonas noertemannii]|uniref:Uncharacterized protein n=1 Tax=Pusillimonas noertemannii TaxID=305977 RepID=A0A2U1CMP6_9BURK|nr:hypothetical protein [Pusillimonas noertemannii]NYT68700.1 hypothetical protein [Pusillimonas noertemannii]PVY62281.1 hypothetical protein C7440_1774 [Pusillimonas noertemannii]TFL10743.1 hypothetical protein CSC72_09490 [Pusillimonas noertemannii]
MAKRLLRVLTSVDLAQLEGLTGGELRRLAQRSAWIHEVAMRRLEQRNAAFAESVGPADAGVVVFVETFR